MAFLLALTVGGTRGHSVSLTSKKFFLRPSRALRNSPLTETEPAPRGRSRWAWHQGSGHDRVITQILQISFEQHTVGTFHLVREDY